MDGEHWTRQRKYTRNIILRQLSHNFLVQLNQHLKQVNSNLTPCCHSSTTIIKTLLLFGLKITQDICKDEVHKFNTHTKKNRHLRFMVQLSTFFIMPLVAYFLQYNAHKTGSISSMTCISINSQTSQTLPHQPKLLFRITLSIYSFSCVGKCVGSVKKKCFMTHSL